MITTIHQLVYLSRSTVAGASPSGSAHEMRHILAASRRNNVRDGITGALLHGQGFFAQALEGPLHALEQTFERIQCDARHDEVMVIDFVQVPERVFGHWSMADVGELTQQAAADLRLDRAFDGPCGVADGILVRLRDLLRRRPRPLA